MPPKKKLSDEEKKLEQYRKAVINAMIKLKEPNSRFLLYDRGIRAKTMNMNNSEFKDFKQDLEKALPDAESYFPFIAPYMPKGISRMFGLLCFVWQHYKYSPYVLLIDDIELHLSPQLQRLILPAVLKMIHPNTTLLVTTHSPLVLASVEPYFDAEQDKLFHFSLVDREIKLEEQPWVKHGDVVNWLTSDIFGLKQARSVEAEQAIDAADTFMRGESLDGFPAHLQSKADIHKELRRLLSGHDRFWPRWVVTANMKLGR